MSTTYRARIIRADDSGLWVSVPALGDAEFGPLESIVSDIIIKPKYTVDDRVIIEQVGSIPEDFIVVGIAARTFGAPPDWSLRDIDASQVVSGVFATSRIPNIDASKVTSGVLDGARIPDLDASQIIGGVLNPAVIPGLDASQVVSGVFATSRIPNLDASKITSGRIPLARLASHNGEPDTTNRVWFTTDPGGGWSGVDHTMLVMSPPTDLPYANALFLRVGNIDRFVVSKEGVISVGTVPANNIDKFTSASNYTNMMGSAGSPTVGWSFQLNEGSGVAGLIHNNAWQVQWNTSGTMLTGSVPADRVNSGVLSVARLPHVVANWSANPPYVILGVQPDLGYDTATTALHLSNFSGTTQGVRARIYDSARKLLFHLNRDSAGDYAAAQAFYDRTTTAAANVQVGTSGALSRSTSLRAAKVSIEDAPESWADKVWDLAPRTWFDKTDADLLADALARQSGGEEVEWDGVLASPLRRIPGFVAEEVEAAGLEEFLVRDETGELSGLAYDRFSAALLVAMKDERQKRIDLEARVGTLVSRIEALEGGAEA